MLWETANDARHNQCTSSTATPTLDTTQAAAASQAANVTTKTTDPAVEAIDHSDAHTIPRLARLTSNMGHSVSAVSSPSDAAQPLPPSTSPQLPFSARRSSVLYRLTPRQVYEGLQAFNRQRSATYECIGGRRYPHPQTHTTKGQHTAARVVAHAAVSPVPAADATAAGGDRGDNEIALPPPTADVLAEEGDHTVAPQAHPSDSASPAPDHEQGDAVRMHTSHHDQTTHQGSHVHGGSVTAAQVQGHVWHLPQESRLQCTHTGVCACVNAHSPFRPP
ncbi:unnamed protein product [Vitrella brassicaformis CCMP3155]|uniref:Uncharacterized protein n=1 Tax=Vitrella brassicaformis (strain CCMP3155) TaxID=1169540 RepID=A0A0G4FTN1_VITBC|nr:unnamed protein product [Vitrella brassicaformis CCMP3155]|eukprot:CEM17774.1 unnamed protein product [Vitrella brassicaformis CCMP3155]